MKDSDKMVLLSIFVLLIPSAVFLQNSKGVGWDNIGHSAEAIVYKEEILPSIYGWNSYFLLGYPIHAYPPLSRIVLALLMDFFDWKTATNLLLVASVLAIIPSLYIFLKSLGVHETQAAFSCLIVAIYMASTYGADNSSFVVQTAYKTGLVASFFAFPFVLLSLAFFKKDIFLSSIFASIAILSNFIATILLFVCLVALVLPEILKRNLKIMPKVAVFALITFMLSAFWLVPYIERSMGAEQWQARGMKYPPLLPSLEGFGIGILLYYTLFVKKKPVENWKAIFAIALIILFLKMLFLAAEKSSSVKMLMLLEMSIAKALPLIALASISFAYLASKKKLEILNFYLGFMILVFGAYFLISVFQSIDAIKVLGVHFYRVNSFLEMLDFAIVAFALWKFIEPNAKLQKYAPYAITGTFLVIGLLFPQSYFKIYLHPPENALEYDFSQAEVAGRAIIYDGKTISNPHGSYFQFYIQRKTLIAQGLFIEHAEMAPIAITYASHITRADPLIWGAARLPSMKNFFEDYKEASIFYSDLLWVTDIILDPNMYKNFMDGSLETIDSSFEIVKEFKAGKNTTFRHYRIGNFSLADVRIAKPKCTDSWKEYIYEWFESGSTQIMYDSCKEVEYSEDDAKNAAVKVKEYSNGRILLDINAPSPVPVLVKEAYDQDWKAYGSDGKELQIYKATPQLMMVFAKGQVLLKYSPKDRVALFALIPFALISIFIIKKKIGYAQ